MFKKQEYDLLTLGEQTSLLLKLKDRLFYFFKCCENAKSKVIYEMQYLTGSVTSETVRI